jgi:hypothetical protein
MQRWEYLTMTKVWDHDRRESRAAYLDGEKIEDREDGPTADDFVN